jgi:IMP dehydrogenase
MTLNPESTGSFAAQMLRDLGVPAVAVAGGRPLFVTLEDAEMGGGSLVSELAQPAPILPAEMDLKEAVSTLSQMKSLCAWVQKSGSFIGLASVSMILDELALSRDAMTGLTWSDHLREWGQERLKEGQELTILFFDLDRFGAYNKRYGHIYGDKVLRQTAQMILDVRDPRRDIVVRYAGDEFVLASTRSRIDLEELRTELEKKTLSVEGIDEKITFSVGIAGGNRGAERTTVHLAATLDNLINLASRDALARKPKKVEAPTLVLHPSEALSLALSAFRQDHPEKAGRIADVQYQVMPEAGLVVNLIDSEGNSLSTAPLGQDLKASLQNALAHFAQAG